MAQEHEHEHEHEQCNRIHMEQSDKKTLFGLLLLWFPASLFIDIGSILVLPFFLFRLLHPPAFISLPNGTTMGCRVIFGCLGFSLPNRF